MNSENSGFEWSTLAKYRGEISRYIHNLQVVHQDEAVDYIIEEIPDDSKLLEIGAHTKNLPEYLADKEIDYFSMDTDRTYDHDFYSIDDIDETFQTIVMIDVIEHMSLKEFLVYLDEIRGLLDDKGTLMIQLPNIFALGSNQFYDATHKQHWPFYDLYAVLRHFGFKSIDIYRLDNIQRDGLFMSNIQYFFRKTFAIWFGNDVDFAPNLLTIARR